MGPSLDENRILRSRVDTQLASELRYTNFLFWGDEPMKQLHATKTSLYKLVAEYVPDLPPMRTKTQFIKYYRSTSYALEWSTPNWDHAHAYFSTSMGYPLLAIEIRDWETGKTISRNTYNLTLQNLQARGMIQEVPG